MIESFGISMFLVEELLRRSIGDAQEFRFMAGVERSIYTCMGMQSQFTQQYN